MSNIDDYMIDIDSECLEQDFDDVDLYGTKLEEPDNDGFGDDLELE